jgi:hypothetical protein
MEMRTIDRSIAFFLPAAAALTIAAGIAFLAVQQDLRIGANDVPQQLAEDAVAALDSGADPTTVVTASPVAIDTSLAPFVVVYGPDGGVLATDGTLDGRPPALPSGVLRSAKDTGRDTVTWQPRAGVRVATVAIPWAGGTVVAGRSLRAIESRIESIQLLALLGWLAGLVVIGAAAVVSAMVWPTGPRDPSAG